MSVLVSCSPPSVVVLSTISLDPRTVIDRLQIGGASSAAVRSSAGLRPAEKDQRPSPFPFESSATTTDVSAFTSIDRTTMGAFARGSTYAAAAAAAAAASSASASSFSASSLSLLPPSMASRAFFSARASARASASAASTLSRFALRLARMAPRSASIGNASGV
eukprot:500306-Pleurochrysis_carterae.AAC.2